MIVGVETLDGYLTALASEQPAPGGGSAATLVAQGAAALVAMVARICSKNPRYLPFHALARATAEQADGLRADLGRQRALDEAAFGRVIAATALPKRTESERAVRSAELERALHDAAAEPLVTAGQALAVLRLAGDLLRIRNRALSSDIACAAEFAHAALLAAGYNVRINHRFMRDAAAVASQAEALAGLEREASALLAQVRLSVREPQ